MPIGFETYVEGTADIQLKDSTIYFSLTAKGVLPQPVNWFNPKGSSADSGYWWGEVTIPHGSSVNEYVTLVLTPTQFPCSIYYHTISKTTGGIKIILTCSSKNIPINYYIFSTKNPLPNPSRSGLELYKEGILVFASETPTLRPLISNANNGSGINVDISKTVGVVCNKQGYSHSYQWSNDGPGEFWYAESENISGVLFSSKNTASPADFIISSTGYAYSGEDGYGERYTGNVTRSYFFIDVTGI